MTFIKGHLFVFESVCAFIAENKLREKGIQYIGVNLSDIQCMQDHLAVDMLQIMREYQIPYDSIDFEIRESAQKRACWRGFTMVNTSPFGIK